MKLLILYWSFLGVSYAVASRLRRAGLTFSWVQPSMMAAIYVMCLIMGLRMGINEQVTSNLGSIGIMSLVVTAFCICGSMLMVFATRKIFGMDRHGDVIKDKRAEENRADKAKAKQEPEKLELKSTFIILGVVVGGMLIGALVLARHFGEYLPAIESVSSYSLIVMLCILLSLVGLDLGSSGTVFQQLRAAGFKIMAFPVAAVIGTLILGTAACMVMGFSLREGVAISLGNGWYTYAPAVIASAGPQYVVASAVSFMYNVIRETVGMIGIPLFARMFGYIESTSVPGVAAMDVCMPIVERSCRQDTIIYSFVTGLFMCLVTSVCVPIAIGV